MEFRAGLPADAEAIAGLIASFQSELTNDPSGAGAAEYLASVSALAEREYLFSARYGYLLACSGSQLAGFIAIQDGSIFFTSLSSAHISARALPGFYGSKPCASCALLTARGSLRSTQAFPPCRCIKHSASLQQDHYRVSMAFRFCPCGVRHC